MARTITVYLDPKDGKFTDEDFYKNLDIVVNWWKQWLKLYLDKYVKEKNLDIKKRMIPGGYGGLKVILLSRPQGYEYFDPPLSIREIEKFYPQEIIKKCIERCYLLIMKVYVKKLDDSEIIIEEDPEKISQFLEGHFSFGRTKFLYTEQNKPEDEVERILSWYRKDLDLKSNLQDALECKDKNEKGKKLEQVISKLFSMFEGFEVVEQNLYTETEEIDIVVQNESIKGIWGKLSPFILIECKNWSNKVGKNELVVFDKKIENRRGQCKVGFLISVNGFTKELRKETLRGSINDRLIVLLDKQKIFELIESYDRLRLLESYYREYLFA